MLEIEGLKKSFGPKTAVSGISFTLNKGDVLGFLGPNGAGKTTTMKIITCFMPPSSGTVQLNDHNIFDHPLEIRKQIGYLPEHNPLYLTCTSTNTSDLWVVFSN